MTGLLQFAGVRQRDKAQWLADQLRVSHRPLTLMFRDTLGIDLHPVPLSRGKRGLNESEAGLLGAPLGKPCRYRTGRLDTAAGDWAAGAWLLWVPGYLPAEVNAALDAASEPAGAVLDRMMPGGMHREDLRAVAAAVPDEITGRTASVRCKATLVAGGRPVGLVEENLLAGFVESLP